MQGEETVMNLEQAVTKEQSGDVSNQAKDGERPLSPAAPEDFDLWLEAGRTEKHYWLDLWRYRELFAILAWRDLSVRYKQTVIGVLWALVRPVLTMAVFTVVFGRIAALPSDGITPYPLMVFAGMLPWTLFSTGLADASN